MRATIINKPNPNNPKIIILPELRELIRPLSKSEFEQLEQNIITEGIRDMLILWKRGEEHILVDGHNRFSISQKYGLDFRFLEREFADIDAVKEWMITNQLGKRNLTENEISYLRGLQYRQMKSTHGGDRKTETSKVQNEPLNPNITKAFTTASKLAETHKVSEATIKRDEEYADALDKIASSNPELRNKILTKDVNISKKDLKEIAELPAEKIKEVAKGLEENRPLSSLLTKKPSKNSHFVNFLKEKETSKETETPKFHEIAENSEVPKKTWEIGRYKSKDEYGTYYMSVGRDQEKNEFHALYIVDEGNYKYTIRELKESEMPNAAHYEQIAGQEFNRVHEIASIKLCKNQPESNAVLSITNLQKEIEKLKADLKTENQHFETQKEMTEKYMNLSSERFDELQKYEGGEVYFIDFHQKLQSKNKLHDAIYEYLKKLDRQLISNSATTGKSLDDFRKKLTADIKAICEAHPRCKPETANFSGFEYSISNPENGEKHIWVSDQYGLRLMRVRKNLKDE